MIKEIPIKDIEVKENHRTNVQSTHLNELMQSIKQNGLQHPIGVIEERGGKYLLNFGHRRLLACQKLGMTKIEAKIIKDTDDKDFTIRNLTENMQRRDPSFAELGRAVDKLLKDKMTFKEIEVRLGVPEKKLRAIVQTYRGIPAKHREKVKFMGKGSDRDGSIPADLARHIANVKRHYNLDAKSVDQLFEAVEKNALKYPDLTNLGALLNSGVDIESALKKINDYHVYNVEIVAHKGLIQRLMQEKSIESQGILFKKIVYGLLPPIQKPDFIKLGK